MVEVVFKKRKLQAEQLGLPIPKHTCWEHNFPSDVVSMFDENPDEVQNMQTHVIKGKIEGVALNDGSEPGSGKDSNSFAGDTYDSAMSVYSEGELKRAYEKTCLYDRPSSSSANSDVNSFKDTNNSLDGMAVVEANYSAEELKFVSGVHQPLQHLEEQQLQDFGDEANYICSEYGDHFTEECTDKEVEAIIYANSLNPNTYVLSSGRWSVNQGN